MELQEVKQVKNHFGIKKKHDNQWYGSRGGEDTRDYIYLLSIEEVVCKYFGDSSKNLAMMIKERFDL